ncbi:MAG TPA: non-homologous end-joining DNA ligase [Acidobacteriota bacterium]|nr:non-homologous end-joining DNA ligase [Acidobacteriota bacterium]
MARSDHSSPANQDAIAGVRLTNPDRVLYPGQGLTKRSLAEYYESVAHLILPHIAGRPLTVVRCPRGHENQCFYQKHVTESLPDSIRGVEIQEKEGVGVYIVIDSLTELITLVQFGALEFHPWGSREDRIESPDRLIFDLDPGPDSPWEYVIQGAHMLRAQLSDLGLQSFAKTTGGKGLHIMVPLMRRIGWEELKSFARAIAESIVAKEPEKYLVSMSKEKRRGKVFVDYLRNSRGATSIAAFSARARSHAPVATPVGWNEVSVELNPAGHSVENIHRRLESLKKDPWEGFFTIRQSITKAMQKKLGVT